jgi:hypothetical protein
MTRVKRILQDKAYDVILELYFYNRKYQEEYGEIVERRMYRELQEMAIKRSISMTRPPPCTGTGLSRHIALRVKN